MNDTLRRASATRRANDASSRDIAFEILKYAREYLAPFLRVRRLEFFELPKTISGKIRRVELRAREEEGTGADTEFRDDQFPELKG